jgi:5-formyltetrahydrofolate cyclo-ligase
MIQEIDRQKLRKSILAQRDMMTEADRREKSVKIAENLWQLGEVEAAGSIFIYVNFRSEVETVELIRQCLARGKEVTVPYTDVKAKALLPIRITDPDKDLSPGYCSIPEPDPDPAAEIPAETIDIVIIPGSVFDTNGGRLGYGGGYYDRFLVNDAPQAKRIGLAFEVQVVEKVPMLFHDQFLNILITEKRTVKIISEKEERANA